MYISENNKSARKFYLIKRVRPYIFVTLFCIIFSSIYAQFSHGVSSPHMTYLFLYPLSLGVLAGLLLAYISPIKIDSFPATHFYHTGVAALTLSSMLRGIFEIAGTSSNLETFLMIVSLLMIAIGVFYFSASTINQISRYRRNKQ